MIPGVVVGRVVTLDPAWFAHCDFGFGPEAHAYPFDSAFAVPRAGRMLALARLDGKVAGYIACQCDEGAAEVRRLEIDRARRGRGLGRLLLDEARLWAAEQGLAALRLETLPDNPGAGRFFGEYGFTLIHEAEALHWRLPLPG